MRRESRSGKQFNLVIDEEPFDKACHVIEHYPVEIWLGPSLKGNSPRQIKDEVDSVYWDSAPSLTTVKFWAAELTWPGGNGSKKSKVMAIVSYDIRGVILIDYLQKGKTITGSYFASLIDKLKAELAEKRPHLQKKKFLFYQDNASSRISAIVMVKIHELWFELLDFPPYSPVLAPKRLLFLPSSKNCALRTEIFVKRRGYHLREQLFSREKRLVLFRRVTE
ncbi:histone-lysine N-methyltransferase SETMAR [Trichonephila clavipes]|nr:histone-lysine N-methyltransferase SETMAR [Trichonephila clavipes]